MNRTLSAFFFFFSIFPELFPANILQARSKTDSLLEVLESNRNDSFKIDALIQLSSRFNSNDPARALEYGKKALHLAFQRGLQKRTGQSFSSIGNVFYVQSRYDSALYYYRESERIFRKIGYLQGVATAVNNVGLVYINRGDYPRGLDYQLNSLKLREQLRDSDGIAFNYNAIAVIYLQKGDMKKALEYQLRSLAIMEKRKNARGIMTNLNNIGNIYYELGEYDRALEYDLKSLKKAQEINDLNGMANVYGNLANIFTKQGLHVKALDYYEKSIALQKEMNDLTGMSSNYHSMAEVFRSLEKYPQSLSHEKRALELALAVRGREQLVNAYRGLAHSYHFLSDPLNAYHYMERYAALKDSITREEGERNLAEMQERFDSETKEKEIAFLKQESKINALEDERKSTYMKFTIAGLVLMIIVALLIYNRYRIKQKANQELKSAYHLIEEKNKSITDSIRYAKRIQESLLPTQRYLDKALSKLKGEDRDRS